MVKAHGTVVLNGVTDQELVKILEIKIGHESSLSFNPSQMQNNTVNLGGKAVITYNNVALGWANENGLEAVQEIIHFLLKKEESEKAVGQ